MVNVANQLAQSDTISHMLVLGGKYFPRWLKSTGQTQNPNTRVDIIGKGAWEDWQPVTPMDHIKAVQSPEFTNAIRTAILENQAANPEDNHAGIIYNILMVGLVDVATDLNLKRFLLSPVPFYMLRLAGMQNADGSSKPSDSFKLKGIGGPSNEVELELGDIADLTTPVFHKMLPAMKGLCGQIYSNTNLGLEGDSYEQEHLPNMVPRTRPYFLGHSLPPLYERALDDPKAFETQLASANASDESIEFLNRQEKKSVVYIAVGSIASFSIPQAKFLIEQLRKHNQKWIIVFLKNKEGLEAAIGDHPDGIIVSWAPQLEVLIHPSTKCIISHAGFGTMIESVFAGQPCITAPLSSDNFINTKVLISLGICVGAIAVNGNQSVMTRQNFDPIFHDDDGETIAQVFEGAFGRRDALDEAREATLRLRKRMAEAKRVDGAAQLADLRAVLASSI